MTFKQFNRTEIKQAINRVANTEDGRIFLAVLASECGFFKNLMSDDPNRTQMFAAQRGVYAKIRNNIRPDLLRKAEYGIEIVEDEIKKNG